MNIDKLLKKVQKPARYIGNEFNSVHKDASNDMTRFAFCFPDTYEVGMSHLGMKILYHLLNEQQNIYCERVFAPWSDMEEQMRLSDTPLFALESSDPIKDFDIIGFTLQYEMSYTNILNMLDLAQIPLRAKNRTDGNPFVCVGGPCAFNCEPLADFVDFAILGEGEEVILEVLDKYTAWKGKSLSRVDFLHSIASIEGVYVPSLYEVLYNDDGTVASVIPTNACAPQKIKKRIIADVDGAYYPDKIIVPFMEIIHDRAMLELFRGCIRGCRFCQAGFIYRPLRERSSARLESLAKSLIDNTGYEEISLSSLSSGDYTEFFPLTNKLVDLTEGKKTNLALPSLRLDSFSLELMQKVQGVRKSSFTFAPEAGSQRMRDVVNKNITEQDLLTSVGLAFSGGWSTLKLYFMIGLPFETDDDVAQIASLGQKVLGEYFAIPKEQRGKSPRINLSASSFVPKPFTPFQWARQNNIEELRKKQAIIRNNIKSRQINFSYHESPVSHLEGVFARGDRRLGDVLEAAFKNGCKFDGWDEHFRYQKWAEAFAACGVDPLFYTDRERDASEVFPWDHIDVGVSKSFLLRERERAQAGLVSPNCRESCTSCGANIAFDGGECVAK